MRTPLARFTVLLTIGCCVGALAAVERPSTQEIEQRESVRLKVVPRADGLLLRWDQPNRSPSDGIKIVLSTEHDQPVYGHGLDPFVHWVAGTGHTETLVPMQRLLDLSQGRRFHLRAIFVHQANHSDPRHHVAYTNVVTIEPQMRDPAQDHLAKEPHDRPVARFPGRQHHGQKEDWHKGDGQKGDGEKKDWHKGDGHKEDWHKKDAHGHKDGAHGWHDQSKHEASLRERIAAHLQRRGEQRVVEAHHHKHRPALAPPTELERVDLTPTERALVLEIYQLEQRKRALELMLTRSGD